MPVLRNKPWTQEEKTQLAAIFPIIQQDVLKNLFEPIRQANEAMAKTFSLGLALPIKTLADQFSKIAIPPLPTNIFPEISYLPEIIEDIDIPTLKPRPVIRQKKKSVEFYTYHESFSIGITEEGTFYYKNRLLSHVFTSSKHGKLLKLLLEAESNYLTDTILLKVLCPPDFDKGLGYIRKDLMRYLTKDNLKIDIYRSRKQGYKLRKITKVRN